MKFKKISALMLAMGLMVSSMTVMAEEAAGSTTGGVSDCTTGEVSKPLYYAPVQGPTGGYYEASGDKYNFYGEEKPVMGENAPDVSWANGSTWTKGDNDYWIWDGTEWKQEEVKGSSSSSSSSKSSSSSSSKKSKTKKAEPDGPRPLTKQDIADIISQAETAALQSAAAGEGFVDIAEMQRAEAKNMSAGEYFNNVAVTTPGIEKAVPVGQGGNIVIDGKVTGAMATVSKVNVAFVDSVRASVEGTVLNVVDVQFPAMEATINFYMPGVAADANIAAVQYVDGRWVDVEVAEVRADHVVLNLKQNGKVAFIAK